MSDYKHAFMVAIDGPVASGKGTIARHLAEKINRFYLYSGAFYRCIGLYCLENSINTKDEQSVIKVLPDIKVKITKEGIYLNDQEVSQGITNENVALAASDVSLYQEAQNKMTGMMLIIAQEFLQKNIPVVTEGRDMATSVFPQAELKVYLTADVAVRVERRFLQLRSKGEQVLFKKVLANTLLRDKQDSERQHSPLATDPNKLGYFIIDNSKLTPDETSRVIMRELERRGLIHG